MPNPKVKSPLHQVHVYLCNRSSQIIKIENLKQYHKVHKKSKGLSKFWCRRLPLSCFLTRSNSASFRAERISLAPKLASCLASTSPRHPTYKSKYVYKEHWKFSNENLKIYYPLRDKRFQKRSEKENRTQKQFNRKNHLSILNSDATFLIPITIAFQNQLNLYYSSVEANSDATKLKLLHTHFFSSSISSKTLLFLGPSEPNTCQYNALQQTLQLFLLSS